MLHVERYTMTVFVGIVRLGAGPDWRPGEAWLSVPGNVRIPEWEALADARIHLEAPFSAILVPDDVMSLALPNWGPGPGNAGSEAERRLQEQEDTDYRSDRVVANARERFASFGMLAEDLGMVL